MLIARQLVIGQAAGPGRTPDLIEANHGVTPLIPIPDAVGQKLVDGLPRRTIDLRPGCLDAGERFDRPSNDAKIHIGARA